MANNTRDIRNRIRSVKNTAKITRAMQLVASSKMKRAQDQALQGRAYTTLLARMVADLAGKIDLDTFAHPFLTGRPVRTRGILVIATDRGLCGPLNSNLFRFLVSEVGKDNAAFITIGRKARQFISRTGRNLLADFPVPEGARFADLRPVLEFMLEAYADHTIDTVEVIYPAFRNTLVQTPRSVPLLPITDFQQRIDQMLREAGQPEPEDNREMLFEPSPADILNALLDLTVKREAYQLLLDTRASEHSARMVAMKSATDNANKLVDQLTLEYNKARQASITQEILEITAATLYS